VECPKAAAQPPVPLRYEDSGGVEGEPAGWPAADQRLAERLQSVYCKKYPGGEKVVPFLWQRSEGH